MSTEKWKSIFPQWVAEAKEAVKEIDEPYRGLAFNVYLTLLASSGTVANKIDTERTRPSAAPSAMSGMPSELVAKIQDMPYSDEVGFLLYYEKEVMTKQEMISKSIELGRELPANWMDKKFAENTKGLVAPVETEAGRAYKLSVQGRLTLQNKERELLQPKKAE